MGLGKALQVGYQIHTGTEGKECKATKREGDSMRDDFIVFQRTKEVQQVGKDTSKANVVSIAGGKYRTICSFSAKSGW